MQGAKWGVVVIMLALVGAVIGSYVMSMDVIEQEVTKYNPLADMTGEFEREQTPEYVEYNPSTNYTGYYTDDSIVGIKKYFDGVSFTDSIQPNNFVIQSKPTLSVLGTVDLNTVTGAQINEGHSAYYAYEYDGETYAKLTGRSSIVSLSDLISFLDPTNQYNAFVFKAADSMSAANPVPTSDCTVDWCFFFADQQAVSSNLNLKGLGASGQLVPADSEYPPLSAFVDKTTGLTTIYYDNDLDQSKMLGTFSTSDCLVMFEYPTTHSYDLGLIIGDTISYELLNMPNKQYMDPSAGVEIE